MKKFGLMLVALLVLTAASVVVQGTAYATAPADTPPADEQPPEEKPVWKPGDPKPALDSPKADHNACVADLAEKTRDLRNRLTAATKKREDARKVLTGLERPSPPVQTWKDGEEPTEEQVKVYNKQARKYQKWYDDLSPVNKALAAKAFADIGEANDEIEEAGQELFGKYDKKNGRADGNGKDKEYNDAIDLRKENCKKHGDE